MGPTKMTPEDQQFNISFVAAVKKHPCLFDSNSTEYKQANMQDNAWQDVSAAVNESVDLCKKRWRNLRCCMTRYLKSVRDNADSGSNVRRKPYYLYNHMQFVIPYLKMKDGEGSMCESDETAWIKGSGGGSRELMKADDDDEEEDGQEIETIDVQEEDHQQIKQSIIESIKILPMAEQQSQETTTTTYEIIEATPSKQPRIGTVHQVAVSAPVTASKQKGDPLSPIKHYTYTTLGTTPVNTTTLFASTPLATGQSQTQLATSSTNILRQHVAPLQQQHQQQQQQQQISSNAAATDADNNFFKSLIPDIQSMNMDQKRKLKIGILRLIDEILSTT